MRRIISITSLMIGVLCGPLSPDASAQGHDEKHEHDRKEAAMTTLTIPASLKAEHEKLHATLKEAIDEGGRVGAAAKKVAALLHHHFEQEEEFAMPQLGLLADLANGNATSGMREAIAMSDRLKKELATMLLEHKRVVVALEELIESARAENKPKYVQFANDLKLHAQNEEEVLYPAAILVGEYLKLKLAE